MIYRLSLPWKPRRDRLARHPHIRVDSGLLYSPPSLTLFCSHPPPSPLYTHRSVSYSSSLSSSVLISSPPSLTSLRPPLSARFYPLSPPLLSLSSQYTRSMSPFITRHPEPDPSFFLCVLRTSSCLSKRVFFSDSFVFSFLCRVIPSRFRVSYASFLSHYPVPRSYLLNRIISLAPFRHFSLSPSLSFVHFHSCSFSLSVQLPRTSSYLIARLSLSLWTSPRPTLSSVPAILSRLSARTSTITHPRHHPVTSPIALFHAPDRECALISHSLSPCLLLTLSSLLFLSFTSPLLESLHLFAYPS